MLPPQISDTYIILIKHFTTHVHAVVLWTLTDTRDVADSIYTVKHRYPAVLTLLMGAGSEGAAPGREGAPGRRASAAAFGSDNPAALSV